MPPDFNRSFWNIADKKETGTSDFSKVSGLYWIAVEWYVVEAASIKLCRKCLINPRYFWHNSINAPKNAPNSSLLGRSLKQSALSQQVPEIRVSKNARIRGNLPPACKSQLTLCSEIDFVITGNAMSFKVSN
jgi:hypothetical protein